MPVDTGSGSATSTPAAANDLSLTAAVMVDRLEDFMGWSSPTSAQSADMLKRLNDGYARALRGEHFDPSTGELAYHDWNFLKPIAQLSIGGATTGTATVATAGTATATTAIFDESMVGLTMTVTDYDGALTDLEVDITGYTSTTVVTIDDDTNTWAAKAISVPSTGIYDLPALFGGLLEPMGYHYSSSGQSDIVEVTPEEIQERWRQSKSLGIPDKYAIVPKTFTTATGQRFQAWFNSLPSAAMVIRYRYRLLQAPLTDAAVYPVGGPDFNRLVLVAGLAACEHAKSVRDGTNESIYQGTVQALIKLDRSAFSAGDAPERLINEGLEA